MPIRFSKPGLVVYLTAGDPDLPTTREIALAAIDAGAEVLELGVPFSDPLADGPVIQRASERAVKNGTKLSDVLALAADLRSKRPHAGLVIFSYFNPVLRFGLERFCAAAKEAGIDGVLITDMIVEEADEYLAHLRRHRLAPIFSPPPQARMSACSALHRLHRDSSTRSRVPALPARSRRWRRMQNSWSRACVSLRICPLPSASASQTRSISQQSANSRMPPSSAAPSLP